MTEKPPTSSSQSMEKMGDFDEMETAEAFLIFAEKGPGTDEWIAEQLSKLLVDLKRGTHFAHYAAKLDPDNYHSETKNLSHVAKKRIRMAFELFTNETSK